MNKAHYEMKEILEALHQGKIDRDEALQEIRRLEKELAGRATPATTEFRQGEILLRDHKLYGVEILMGIVHCSLALEGLHRHFPGKKPTGMGRISFTTPVIFGAGQQRDVAAHVNRVDRDGTPG